MGLRALICIFHDLGSEKKGEVESTGGGNERELVEGGKKKVVVKT